MQNIDNEYSIMKIIINEMTHIYSTHGHLLSIQPWTSPNVGKNLREVSSRMWKCYRADLTLVSVVWLTNLYTVKCFSKKFCCYIVGIELQKMRKHFGYQFFLNQRK